MWIWRDESAGDTVAPGGPPELGGTCAKRRDANACGFGFEGERRVARGSGAKRLGTLGRPGELERDPPELVAGPGPKSSRRGTRPAREERHACHPPSGIRGRTASGSVTCSRQERQ